MSCLRTLPNPNHLPALDSSFVYRRPALGLAPLDPAPRILLLYGSLRERSFSRLVVEEAARLLQLFGAETRIFDPSTLPLPDQLAGDDHPATDLVTRGLMTLDGIAGDAPGVALLRAILRIGEPPADIGERRGKQPREPQDMISIHAGRRDDATQGIATSIGVSDDRCIPARRCYRCIAFLEGRRCPIVTCHALHSGAGRAIVSRRFGTVLDESR